MILPLDKTSLCQSTLHKNHFLQVNQGFWILIIPMSEIFKIEVTFCHS